MNDRVKTFGDLHIPGKPLILYNIWDAGSAKAVAEAGAKAIATGSWGVANSLGYKDGETLPLDAALDNLVRILSVTDLPVTIDMEAGYGADPAVVKASVARAAEAGAVGINIEDKDPATRQLFATADAVARIKAAAASGLWINARSDLFIVTPKEQHDADLVDAVVERATAYADAGANSLFVPFMYNAALIGKLCEKSPLPVNILVGQGIPDIKTLAELGVARISHGYGPWAKAMADLAEAAREAMAQVA
ncbi:MAG: isocitrate lyase/phosphoenolpyruvate mutase family protein [Sphingomonadaceae bacterium]|nr:isocitrate lyase/phosphoenolpyruvate mutase family protein [Sphingomonadaceae bacterium]